jgi:hypothetical protein
MRNHPIPQPTETTRRYPKPCDGCGCIDCPGCDPDAPVCEATEAEDYSPECPCPRCVQLCAEQAEDTAITAASDPVHPTPPHGPLADFVSLVEEMLDDDPNEFPEERVRLVFSRTLAGNFRAELRSVGRTGTDYPVFDFHGDRSLCSDAPSLLVALESLFNCCAFPTDRS